MVQYTILLKKNLKFARLEKQFKDKKQWIKGGSRNLKQLSKFLMKEVVIRYLKKLKVLL